MTSSNGNIFRVTGPLSGEFKDYRWISLRKTRSFDVFFDLRLNKRLSKKSRRRLRRHRADYDVSVMGRWEVNPGLVVNIVIIYSAVHTQQVFLPKYPDRHSSITIITEYHMMSRYMLTWQAAKLSLLFWTLVSFIIYNTPINVYNWVCSENFQ